MNREEHERRYKAMQAARQAYASGCPGQFEVLCELEGSASVVVSWVARINRETCAASFVLGDCEWNPTAMTPKALRRLADIKEAGERWERNEGPWPLSATPQKEEG